MYKYFLRNGEVLPISKAIVSLLSVEYAYGFGVYETLRVVNKKALFLEEHTERLVKSATLIKLSHSFVKQDIECFTNDLLSQTEEGTYNLKMLLIGGQKTEDATLYMFCSNPLFPDRKLYRDGVKTITNQYERIYPHAKTLNMLQSYLSFREAKGQGCYDALFVNREGNITEGTRTNFFTIKGNTIYSPLEKDILLGVTRKHILEVAKENSFDVIEQNIPLSSLNEYDGAFFTSTSSKIMPIKSIDGFEYKEVPAALKRLMTAFDEYLTKLELL